MSLHVGTSGWAYKEWKPEFYPADLPQAGFLSHYAARLTGCEINATFYRLQAEPTVTRWAEQTPPGFRFAVKAHRRLTHGRDLAAGEGWPEFMARFLESLRPLRERLGVVLLQFPATRPRDDAALADVIASLPTDLPFAVEFRHASWDEPAVAATIAAAGGTICHTDTAGEVPAALPPGPLGYVRLRGEHYSEQARVGWRDLMRREAAARPVFVFAKHEGVPAGDPACGVTLAESLAREIVQEA